MSNFYKHLEWKHQKAYFDWVRIKQNQDPRYYLIGSSQNGANLAPSNCYSKTPLTIEERKGRAKGYAIAAGLRVGFPDIYCLVPSSIFHGLFMELKIKPNKPSKEQISWIDKLNAQGYQAVVAWSYEEMISITEAYLNFAFYRQNETRQKLTLVPKANFQDKGEE